MVVRGDLPRGLQAANIVHAAGESGPAERGTHAVCLVAPNATVLAAVAERLEAAGVRCARIVESDPPYAGELMAIGCPPGGREVVRRVLSSLPLLR